MSECHLYSEALEANNSVRNGEKLREALDEVYSSEPSELDRVLAQIQLVSLLDEDW